MGEIRHVLASDEHDPASLPYASRMVIEDCVGETVHVHMGNIRTEFSPEQFLWFADHVAKAATALRAVMHEDGRL